MNNGAPEQADTGILQTSRGPVTRRPEQPGDAAFLRALFISHVMETMASMPVDDAMKQQLADMQWRGQTTSYRAHHPNARFDILEIDGNPIGRIVVDESGPEGWIVDLAMARDVRGKGWGTAILRAVLTDFAHSGRPMRCMVRPDNEASLRMLAAAGFIRIGDLAASLLLEWRP